MTATHDDSAPWTPPQEIWKLEPNQPIADPYNEDPYFPDPYAKF